MENLTLDMLSRGDLQKRIAELEIQEQQHGKRGDHINAHRIADILSQHSQALISRNNVYRDMTGDTGRTYWLAQSRLPGGAEDTLEDAKRFFQAGETFYYAGRLSDALEQYQRSLKIRQRLDSNSLSVAYSYNNVGKVLADQRKFDEAMECHRQCLEHLRRLNRQWFANLESVQPEDEPRYLDPNHSYAVSYADTYNRMGNIYHAQGNLTEALAQHEKSLAIQQIYDPDGLTVANSYQHIGNVYYSRGEYEIALRYYQDNVSIRSRLDPNSLSTAAAYVSLGNAFQALYKLHDALEPYLKGIQIAKHGAPDSLFLASMYNNIGNVYSLKKKFVKALQYYKKALVIQEQLDPRGLSTSYSYINIGNVYNTKDKSEEALNHYNKAITIQERLVPKSLSVATLYHNMGQAYKSQNKPLQALEWFQKSYDIRAANLGPTHPALLFLENALAKTALDVQDSRYHTYAVSLCEKIISNDPNYKYAYDTMGLALHKQGHLNEAVAAFDQALQCDPGYADASIHRLEVIAEIARQNLDFHRISVECANAKKLEKTNYDETKRRQLEIVAQERRFPAERVPEERVEVPSNVFEPGDASFNRRIEAVYNDFKALFESQQSQLNEHNARLYALEERVDILDGQVLNLQDSLRIIKSATDDLDKKIGQMNQNDPLLQKLLSEKRRLVEREQQIKSFNRDPDQRHYYHSFLSELERAYMAAQVMRTAKFNEARSETFSKAAGYMEKYLKLVPVVGDMLSQTVTIIAELADMRNAIKSKVEFMRILDLGTSESFDQIAIKVAVECTLKRRQALALLKGSRVPEDWKAKARAFRDDGLEGLMTQFLKDNETLAKVYGWNDACKVLAHLQQEAVSENYAALEEDQDNVSSLRRKASVIGLDIVKTVFEENIPHSVEEDLDDSVEEDSDDAVETPSLSDKLPDNLADEILELEASCANYTAHTPEKVVAVRRLQEFLHRRLVGPRITAQEILNHINTCLASDNPIFAPRLGGNTVRDIFESARCLMRRVSNIETAPRQRRT